MPTKGEIRGVWTALKPGGYGDTWSPEPWENYWSRIRYLIPNFPPVAAEQWLWRHCTSVLGFSWLWLPDLVFRAEQRSVPRILEEIQGWPNHGLIEKWS